MSVRLYDTSDGRYGVSVEGNDHVYGYIAETRAERVRVLFFLLRGVHGRARFYAAFVLVATALTAAGMVLALALRTLGVLP